MADTLYAGVSGYGGRLPEGAPPFGNCDMNSADGLTAEDFARACGVVTTDSAAVQVANSRIRRKSRLE